MKASEVILNEKLNDYFMEEHVSPKKVYVQYKEGKLHIYVKTPKDYRPCLIVEPNAQYSLGMTLTIADVDITEQQYDNLYAYESTVSPNEQALVQSLDTWETSNK